MYHYKIIKYKDNTLKTILYADKLESILKYFNITENNLIKNNYIINYNNYVYKIDVQMPDLELKKDKFKKRNIAVIKYLYFPYIFEGIIQQKGPYTLETKYDGKFIIFDKKKFKPRKFIKYHFQNLDLFLKSGRLDNIDLDTQIYYLTEEDFKKNKLFFLNCIIY
jgi:hypothetical protein